MILGAALTREAGVEDPLRFVFFPVVVHAFDILVSSVGVMYVKTADTGELEDPLVVLKRGYRMALGLSSVGFALACRWLLSTEKARLRSRLRSQFTQHKCVSWGT